MTEREWNGQKNGALSLTRRLVKEELDRLPSPTPCRFMSDRRTPLSLRDVVLQNIAGLNQLPLLDPRTRSFSI